MAVSQELMPVRQRVVQRRLHQIFSVEFGPQPAVKMHPRQYAQVRSQRFNRFVAALGEMAHAALP